jgi:hypothetical protein
MKITQGCKNRHCRKIFPRRVTRPCAGCGEPVCAHHCKGFDTPSPYCAKCCEAGKLRRSPAQEGMSRINQHGMRYDECKNKGIAIARQVSAILKAAGFPKSGGYHPFEHRDPGFQVRESGNGTSAKPTASVFWCNERFAAETKEARMFDAIEADGRFDVDRKFGYVTRKEETRHKKR